jgi:hypothetical protein
VAAAADEMNWLRTTVRSYPQRRIERPASEGISSQVITCSPRDNVQNGIKAGVWIAWGTRREEHRLCQRCNATTV